MFIAILIFCGAVLLFALFFRGITMAKVASLQSLESERQKLTSKYEFLREQKKELKAALAEKEHQLATLKNSQEGIKTLSAKELNIDSSAESPDEKISRYLLQKAKITLEQNEKVQKKMKTLQMDFLGACLTLGYIDIKTAQAAAKANKLQHKLNTQ